MSVDPNAKTEENEPVRVPTRRRVSLAVIVLLVVAASASWGPAP